MAIQIEVAHSTPILCAVCHGDNGVGIDKIPPLNDAQKLQEFDDAWYRETIAHGRPDKGMPTWGTVLAPQQIADVIAYVMSLNTK